MRINEFDPQTAFAIRVCAALNGTSSSAWVRGLVQREIGRIVAGSPLVADAIAKGPGK